MPEDDFHGKADTLLETLHEMMDTIVEEEDIPDSDVEFGVCLPCNLHCMLITSVMESLPKSMMDLLPYTHTLWACACSKESSL